MSQGIDAQRVALLLDDGSKAITNAGVRFYQPSSETDAYDIAALEFTEPVRDYPQLRSRFFDLKQVPPNAMSNAVVAVIVAGYPTADQQYDVAEDNHLGLVKRVVTCVLNGQPTDQSLVHVKMLDPTMFDADGMSGGSAFVVQIEGNRPYAYFAGIVLRGGGGNFYVLKSGYVWAFLDSFVSSSGIGLT